MLTCLIFCTYICFSFSKEYVPVDALDLNKYIGTWYQVYQDKFNQLFQGDGTCSTAKYDLTDDGKVYVVNSQYDENGNYDEITGYAYYTPSDI